MRIFAAKITNGVIVPDRPEDLRDGEGTIVSVVVPDGEASFTASSAEEAELLEALDDPAEPIPSEVVLSRLR
jgi:hypothetical protein